MPARYLGPRDPAGQPLEYIPGIPARDLTDDEIAELPISRDELCGSPLYECTASPPERRGKDDA